MLLYSSNADNIEVIVLKINEFVTWICRVNLSWTYLTWISNVSRVSMVGCLKRLIAHEGKEKHTLKRVKLDNKFLFPWSLTKLFTKQWSSKSVRMPQRITAGQNSDFKRGALKMAKVKVSRLYWFELTYSVTLWRHYGKSIVIEFGRGQWRVI